MSDSQSSFNHKKTTKKTGSKPRTTKRHKKTNLEKKRQDTAKIENKTIAKEDKVLTNCENSQKLISNSEICLEKNDVNSTKIITRNSKNLQIKNEVKINSSHNLTESFSALTVTEKNKNKCDKKIENNKSSSKVDENAKPFLSNELSQTAHITLKKNKVKSNIDLTNHKVTEYFHIRRSERKYYKSLLDEEQKNLENQILNQLEDGLKIEEIEGKGRGIITTKAFFRGDFVIEYVGDLIDLNIAKEREKEYSKNKNIGCYMYYFKHKDRKFCIDATEETGKLGRLINHSKKGNLISRIVDINQIPHLVLFAKTDISVGTELLYDYGDRSQESVRNHPWLTL